MAAIVPPRGELVTVELGENADLESARDYAAEGAGRR
jgi:hypothetical protein